MMSGIKILLSVMCLYVGAMIACAQSFEQMDLGGVWRFQLDPMGFGKTTGSEIYYSKLAETIVLPGSTDEGGKGIKNTVAHVDRLSRKFEYCGCAWYQRDICIPDDWKGKEIILTFERCHWETTVYVDGKLAGVGERLSTPNRFMLSKNLSPGIHTLTVCVDNRMKYFMDQWSHGTTEYTQTNWNGIVGRMELQARIPHYMKQVMVFSDMDSNKVNTCICFNDAGETVDGELKIVLCDALGKEIDNKKQVVQLAGKSDTLWVDLDLGKKIKHWDEFNPYLYQIEIDWLTEAGSDSKQMKLGVRCVKQGIHHIRLNGRNIHLRGVLDCAVFPRTGYPATSVEEWMKIFRTVKEYGMNHVRFHSWCPPEAAFDAADQLGLYLQVELPMWIKDAGKYPDRCKFFESEMYSILNEYGNHPSFILMCNGNENEGDFAVLEDLVKKARQYDARHLYSASTARTHVRSNQYYVSHVTEKGWITVYEGKPSTDWDRRKESDIDVPVIAHETGQRCMFPNFEEMKKYTGVLEPRNFEVFRERLTRNGMLHLADDFFRSTGVHTVLQYKEVNEALLRTPNSGGFQLLGLADFPGQGSAFVGILDAFWESKGLVTPEKFRESCAPTVLLARMSKRVYMSDESLDVKLGIYHFGNVPLKRGLLKWYLDTEDGRRLYSGSWRIGEIDCAVTLDSIGRISTKLDKVREPQKLILRVSLNDKVSNEWNFWVYPRLKENDVLAVDNILVAHQYDGKVRAALNSGQSVLLVPSNVSGRKTKFASHFWNPVMFVWDPLIVGTMIADGHQVFKDFPTDNYVDWQWWDILNSSVAIDLSVVPEITPIIQCIDSYETNQKLGVAFEASVGNGKLFVLGVDIQKDMESRPATRQLLKAVKAYVASKEFSPTLHLSLWKVEALFENNSVAEGDDNDAAVRQLLNQ